MSLNNYKIKILKIIFCEKAASHFEEKKVAFAQEKDKTKEKEKEMT